MSKSYTYERVYIRKDGSERRYIQTINRESTTKPVGSGMYRNLALVESLSAELKIDNIDFKNDFQNTGWKRSSDSPWIYTLKSVGGDLPSHDVLPEIREQCYCGTPIHWNHLIQHKDTGKYFTVGSACIKRIGIDMRKMCIECNRFNSKRTSRCGECRVLCRMHNEYHDDNRTCKSDPPKQFVSEPKPSASDPLDIHIRFGKYKYDRTYRWILQNDRSYFRWMSQTIDSEKWLSEYL